MAVSRRKFVANMGAAAAVSFIPMSLNATSAKSPFRVAIITDEISQDFDKACRVAAEEFGMSWVELRELWDKNLMKLDAGEISRAKGILNKYRLRVTDIASPLYKVDWPD